ncbi:MAG TPA: tRNA (guanosine(37)-N1)-methyltransferase TrmD [Candidatus Doudnabacteria bacterium]|nr:tRNA (guanosine(37)-N1)-methyltransferase TrmD [Candidatus Doudnabacteria bacterium]
MKKKPLSISIITLFPEFIQRYSEFGIIARAIQKRLVKFSPVDMRKFGLDKRKTVDDRPYGGGLGMVLRPDVVVKAIQKTSGKKVNSRVILLTPQGKPFNQAHAKRLTKYENLIFVSGRYEGFDERVRRFVDEELSIGDYVLMGGELPALVISEAVLRLVPGVLGKDESADSESFSDNLLEYPQYTKPEVLEVNGKKLRVPKVLLTGHHANVAAWRKQESEKRTKKRRPDLMS